MYKIDKKIIIFKELEIQHISKSILKNCYISVSDTKIILKTPKVSKQFIQLLLLEKEPWIRKQLSKIEKKPILKVNLKDEVLLFGEIHSIDIDEVKNLKKSIKNLKIASEENILKSYDRFYKEYAKIYLTPRLEYFSQLMGLEYSQLKFRKMKSRWGSCNSMGSITLNTQLIKVKKELIDYVLVHELAHLVHMNHSKLFHNLVEKYLPDSKNLKKELRHLGISTF